MCVDVSSGLLYLSNLGIIHCDLAARNVLVASDYTCLISDFGLSRNVRNIVSGSENEEDILPVRWAAPELLQMQHPSSKSYVSIIFSFFCNYFSFSCLDLKLFGLDNFCPLFYVICFDSFFTIPVLSSQKSMYLLAL